MDYWYRHFRRAGGIDRLGNLHTVSRHGWLLMSTLPVFPGAAKRAITDYEGAAVYPLARAALVRLPPGAMAIE